MYTAIGTSWLAQQFSGTIGYHLVGVHVVGGTGSGLKGVHHEVVVPLPGDDFLRRLDDSRADLGIELSQGHVHLSGSPFDDSRGYDPGQVGT